MKRPRLMTPSPPLVRVKEEPTEFDDYNETISLERRAPINGIDTSTNNADYTPAAPEVEDNDQLMCSICSVAKSLDCFSKTQTRKGQQGQQCKCMDCIGSRQLERQLEIRQRNQRKREAEERLAAKNKAMKIWLEERYCLGVDKDKDQLMCTVCNMAKSLDWFYHNQRRCSRGQKRKCMECNEKAQARARALIEETRKIKKENRRRLRWSGGLSAIFFSHA